MALLKSITSSENLKIITIIGFLLTVISLIFTWYISYIQEKSPSLTFDVLSNVKILDIHENIKELNILYKGNNIKDNNEMLSVITLKIINDGKEFIIPSYYDEKSPLGVSIVNGSIVSKSEILSASNKYLADKLEITQKGKQTLTFSKVIIEPGDYFILKILSLHKNAKTPKITPLGKVAGVKKILLASSYIDNNKKTFFELLLSGTATVHTARMFMYLSIFFLSMFLLTSLYVVMMRNLRAMRSRLRATTINNFNSLNMEHVSDFREYITCNYRKYGKHYIYLVKEILNNIDEIERVLNETHLTDDMFEHLHTSCLLGAIHERPYRDDEKVSYTESLIHLLVSKGIISHEGSDIKIDEGAKKDIDLFSIYLKKHAV